MKANELRIGNWVNGNRPYQVNLNVIATHEIERKFKGRNYCEPIPLTEEWLEKFGFSQTIKWAQKVIKEKNCVLNIKKEDGFFAMLSYWREEDGVLLTELKYIHQLQNLFHTLTGTELILSENDSSSK